MQRPILFSAGTREIDLLLKTRNPLKMPRLQTRPTRNIIYACVGLIVMTLLWHRVRAPLEQAGGLIASPPQHEDHPEGHAIVKFKNIKKLPKGIVNMNGMLVDTRLQPGADARVYSEAQKNPHTRLSPHGSEHLAGQVSSPVDATRPKRLQKPSQPAPSKKPLSITSPSTPSPKPKIAKVSMLSDSLTSSIYDSAIRTQENHASLHNYPIHIMRHEIMPSCRGLPVKCNPRDAHSLAGKWNRELYLQSILITELTKPDSERVEWLIWQDGDSITVNPSIPLEIFLPPSDLIEAENIHLIATKDDAGLSTGVFFLRVSPWSVRFLTTCLAVPVTASPDESLGWSYDQSTMAILLEEDEEFKSGVLWQPRRWYNAYGVEDIYAPGQRAEYDPEAKEGSGKVLNVHFPGMSGDQRAPAMAEWLQRLEEEDGWDAAIEETGLLEEVEDFWNSLEKTRREETKELRKAKQL